MGLFLLYGIIQKHMLTLLTNECSYMYIAYYTSAITLSLSRSSIEPSHSPAVGFTGMVAILFFSCLTYTCMDSAVHIQQYISHTRIKQ